MSDSRKALMRDAWIAVGKWTATVARPDAELAPPQYLIDAMSAIEEAIDDGALTDLLDALRDLVARCDGDEGVRADGSNIQTMRAHAAIAKAEGESA